MEAVVDFVGDPKFPIVVGDLALNGFIVQFMDIYIVVLTGDMITQFDGNCAREEISINNYY